LKTVKRRYTTYTMATSKMTEEQTIERLRAHNKMYVAQYKKVNEELLATRNNQRTLIDLLADTMKRLREAEAALEEEKKKPALLVPLLRLNETWRHDLLDRGTLACEALLAGARPWEARACGVEPSTEKPPVEGATAAAAAAAAAAGSSTTEEEDLYA
jgi:hypothetical protein